MNSLFRMFIKIYHAERRLETRVQAAFAQREMRAEQSRWQLERQLDEPGYIEIRWDRRDY